LLPHLHSFPTRRSSDLLSRQWTKAFSALFAIGAVSGAIVEFEITLLWSGLVKNAGAIIGLPFALEGFAFFIEGIFLGVYLFGAKDRKSTRLNSSHQIIS